MIEHISHYWQQYSVQIVNIGYKALLAIVIIIVSLFAKKALCRAIEKASNRLMQLDATLVPVLRTLATYVVYALGTVFILDIFGVNTTSIIALMGAMGLAVGLALKDTLSNIASGIMLLIIRPFRVGDAVEFGSVCGTVKEVNLFTTTLETFDGHFISSPNSTLWDNSIKNFSRNGKRRLDIIVGIDYSDSIDTGLGVLENIIQEESRFLQEPKPRTMVASLADSSVNLQLRGWTTNANYWQTFWDLNKKVKEDIEKAGLTIPFPQQSIHISHKTTQLSNSQERVA